MRDRSLNYLPRVPGTAGKETTRVRAQRAIRAAFVAAVALSAAASTLLAQAPLTPHDPIFIDGNAGFMPENGVTGGSGTSVDPYIIEGWEIVGAPGAGIELVATDAHVVIRNVRVRASNSGVTFGAANVRVEDSEFVDNASNGIVMSGRDVVIRRNVISSSRIGITVFGSKVVIADNDIVQNGTGIYLASSSVVDVTAFHNNMLNNGEGPREVQARDLGGNTWDDGYPNGGNYWTDYLGVDECSGPLQDQCPQPDGIGDTPYVIVNNSFDRYPLIVLPGSENDTVPPTVSIQVPQSGDVFQDIVVSGIATDGESGVRRVEVRLNGGDWQIASGTTAWSLPVLLELGENTLEARSWDHAGNISEVDAATVHAETRWSVEVRTDLPAYLPGQDVRIDVLLSNISDETASLVFSSGCVVHFTIELLEGQVLFDERRHRSCAAVVTTLTVEPGQTQVYSDFIWSQVDDAGNPVPLPSQFIVRGAMDDPSPPTPSDTTRIAVGHTCEDGIDNDLDGLIDYPADPGCTGPEDDREGGEIRDLSVSVRTDQAGYFSGEPVGIEVAITNTGTETVALDFPSSCQAFFTVRDYYWGLVVYDLRRHIECLQVLTSLTLEPG
ncbi:MAG: NosD domain-containing protein, partial [Acidobacteriota bacterium]